MFRQKVLVMHALWQNVLNQRLTALGPSFVVLGVARWAHIVKLFSPTNFAPCSHEETSTRSLHVDLAFHSKHVLLAGLVCPDLRGLGGIYCLCFAPASSPTCVFAFLSPSIYLLLLPPFRVLFFHMQRAEKQPTTSSSTGTSNTAVCGFLNYGKCFRTCKHAVQLSLQAAQL